ncbi:G-type lectin S-receptor-like serine/threonine-protein kinase SD2-5 [Hevea brasiliensis]|uniref:G-type lectin S-receptor-like serine/threonine-protein kinase SD2-5 n=1 Tax=Hevea brasiliensis TaxID=3981 RepID=UPI0025CCB8B5|nr:G-type lectin S-receptor-like serine/threonine-protein kinase SD2-5 [Hevea brasiliensis]
MARLVVQFLVFILNLSILEYSCCQQQDTSVASVSTSWKNNVSSTAMGTFTFSDGSTLRPILAIYSYRQLNFTFGFFKDATSDSFYLSILKHPLSTNSSFNFSNYPPAVLWCANREHPVGENSSLEFKANGNLELRDTDGTLVWSTNTSDASVTRMFLLFGGNLRLVNGSNGVQWESFDYPTDTWAPNQLLHYGQMLTSSVSPSNFSTGLFYLSVADDGVYAFNESNPQTFYQRLFSYNGDFTTFNFGIGSLNQLPNYVKYEPKGRDFQYMRLDPDGHLRVYQLIDGYKNGVVSDLFSNDSFTRQESAKKRGPSSVKKLAIPIPASLSFVIVCVYGAIWYVKRKKKNAKQKDRRESAGQEAEGNESMNRVEDVLTSFSYRDLKSATNNFDPRSKIGRGAFGEVFKGTLNGKTVAVKCLSGFREGRRDFEAEVQTLGRIHHVCLVKLIGYCITRSKRLLVYEYVCNGSLDKWIFHRNGGQPLGWEIRKNIVLSIAKGLLYLHSFCNPQIIHFDIKPQNILLDENFMAKISDFGLAKLIEGEQSRVWTLKGTPGYIAPELLTGNNITSKVDVYSFGIAILEIVCGRKNSSQNDDQVLVDVVKSKVEEGQLSDLVDKQPDIQANMDEAVKMLEIAIHCLQPYRRRPSISTVVKFIEGLTPMERITDYSFLAILPEDTNQDIPASLPLVGSILSGPR